MITEEKKLIKGLWSENEVELLKELFASSTGQEIADQLRRSLPTVRYKAHKMRLKKRGSRRWTQDEVHLLKELFTNRSTREVANQLGRSVNSVREKAHRMGLKKTREYLESMGLVSVARSGRFSFAEGMRNIV